MCYLFRTEVMCWGLPVRGMKLIHAETPRTRSQISLWRRDIRPELNPMRALSVEKPARVSQGLPLDMNLIPVRNADEPTRVSRVQAPTGNQSVWTNPVTVSTLGEGLRDT